MPDYQPSGLPYEYRIALRSNQGDQTHPLEDIHEKARAFYFRCLSQAPDALERMKLNESADQILNRLRGTIYDFSWSHDNIPLRPSMVHLKQEIFVYMAVADTTVNRSRLYHLVHEKPTGRFWPEELTEGEEEFLASLRRFRVDGLKATLM